MACLFFEITSNLKSAMEAGSSNAREGWLSGLRTSMALFVSTKGGDSIKGCRESAENQRFRFGEYRGKDFLRSKQRTAKGAYYG